MGRKPKTAKTLTPEELEVQRHHEELRQRVSTIKDLDFEPWYRTAEEDITQPTEGRFISNYFLDHWVPILGPGPTTVLMRLRKKGYYNPKTRELRNDVRPNLDDLAEAVGIRDPKTVSKYIATLEAWNFVERTKRWRYDATLRHSLQTANVYKVKMWDPVAPIHHEELLARVEDRAIQQKAQTPEKPAGSNDGKNSPHWSNDGKNSSPWGKNSRHYALEKFPSSVSNPSKNTLHTRVSTDFSRKEGSGSTPANPYLPPTRPVLQPTTPHAELVAYFHHQAEHPESRPATSRELRHAEKFLAEPDVDLTAAMGVVDLVLEKAKTIKFPIQEFGGLVRYFPEALNDYRKGNRRRVYDDTDERSRKEQYAAWERNAATPEGIRASKAARFFMSVGRHPSATELELFEQETDQPSA